MAVNLDTRSVQSDTVTELYISAVPTEKASMQTQAEEIFSAIGEVLRKEGAFIFQERVFGIQSAMETVSDIRAKAYGDSDDGVAPSLLVCAEGDAGPIAGVQVHAVVSENKPELISLEKANCGRIFRGPGVTYLALSGISAPELPDATDQARAMLEKSESILKRFGADIHSVPRTWMWLGDILAWYDDFNRARNKFFTERGTLGEGSRQSMPASTGIGLGPANAGSCSMDLTAVIEPPNTIQYLQAAGKQQCAYEYGSAFSRASRAATIVGETVFISGTASIDTSGATTNVGDALAQINTTIENVQAVLKDMHAKDDEVVQAMAYCKTADVEKVFNGLKADVDWPWVTMICDVCRHDLLFEIEVAAVPRK